MKRGILFASIPGLLAVGLCLPVLTSADSAVRATKNELWVYPRQGGCGAAAIGSPDLADVRLALADEIVALGNGATTDVVRETLVRRYGPRVTEVTTPMHYIRVWDEELGQWVVICVSASEFRIDFNDSAIMVASRDTSLVEK